MKSIKQRIEHAGPGWCFNLRSFHDLNSETGVRSALTRLEKDKYIRRLAPGIYEFPMKHDVLGIIPPDVNKVAEAIAEKNGSKIQPSGAHAANITGISEQVPSKIVFLTDGKSKRIKIENTELIFKKANPRLMAMAGTKEGLITQAFKFMKKENINSAVKGRTRKFLEGRSTEELTKNLKNAPAWVRSIVLEIMKGKE